MKIFKTVYNQFLMASHKISFKKLTFFGLIKYMKKMM